MGSLFSLTLMVLILTTSSSATKEQAQGIKSAPLLDLVIRDYTFRSYNNKKYCKTGMLHNVHLPANLSGIGVSTARYRCGSLTRYGAKFNEFHLGIGVTIQPCVERVMLIRQNFGYNWSLIYYDNYDLPGYQLVSPVLGLMAYNAGDDKNLSSPFEVEILANKSPITIDFSKTAMIDNNSGLLAPLCAIFGRGGKVTLANQVSPRVCVAMGDGHFGLVIEAPYGAGEERVSRWKVVVGSVVGAALGAFLLSLLLVALFVKVKKRAKMEEMVRRAYEEEALRVSMVGHVRAPIASATRTGPAIEHEYRASPS